MNNIYLISIILLFLSGCAVMEDQIDINYVGRGNIEVVDGADKVNLTVTKADRRSVYKDRVGVKLNGYGMEMAKITSKKDVSEIFSKAVTFELENLGFNIASGGKTVKVELVRFYNDFKIGWWAGDAVGDGLIQILVTSNDNKILFSRTYEGGFIHKNIQLATGGNAKIALEGTLTDLIAKIAGDKELHDALLQ